VAGGFTFADNSWESKSSAVFFAMEFIADHLATGPESDRIRELADNNVLMLDLSGPEQAAAVDVLADELPNHIANIPDAERRRNLTILFSELCSLARNQQNYNRHAIKD
jgi:hypothetical protein